MKYKSIPRIQHLIPTVFLILLLSLQSVFAATKAEIDTYSAHIPELFADAPELASESAILVDIDSGAIIYAKNPTRSMYPASTTKLMTAYLTLKYCQLDDIVTYSKKAILSLEPGSSHIGLKAGESLTVEDSLYGLLLPSANEAANGLAEHVSGSISAFANLMNEEAASLGCVNTNFANANGLHDPNHMTCAYDLYLIMEACIRQNDFIRIASDTAYMRYADDVLNKDIPMGTTNQFLKKDSEFYDKTVICGKTGWTEQAGRCLVTYAIRNDMNLICVVMNSKSPNQYTDTQLLLNYAERNFQSVRPYDQDTQLNTDSLRADTPLGISEDTVSLMELDASSRILLPNSVTFSDLTRKMTENADGSHTITYKLDGYPLGTVNLIQQSEDNSQIGLWNDTRSTSGLLSALDITRLHTVNVWLVLAIAAAILLLAILLILIIRIMMAPKEPPAHEEEEHHYHFL
ncbi:MAG: D-alanyl-D-alanine carboxypeptidase [Lachnospiraceae bacterium]|nr:D-alanyl-D-alanine carboxypeptidase [Lachnospiraceae bacterium]